MRPQKGPHDPASHYETSDFFMEERARYLLSFEPEFRNNYRNISAFRNQKSLQTDSYRLAVKLARVYRVELDKEMAKLKQGPYSALQTTFSGKVKARLPDGSEELVEGEIHRDIASPDEATAHKEYLLRQLREEAERKEKQAREQALFQAQLAAITSPQPIVNTVQTRNPNLREATLSEIAEEFVKAKIADSKWSPAPTNSTHSQGVARLKQLIEIVGDKQSVELTELDAIRLEEVLPNVPANPNKGVLATLPNLQAKIETDHIKHPRLSKLTQSKYWELFKELIKFAKQKKYIESDITENCRGIKVSKKESKASQWRKFTDEDLQNIFNGYVYQSNKTARTRAHDYHFWLPLLAAFTGARINELCQLLVTDIKQYQDIWYIDITDEDKEGRKIKGKSIKSEAGKRKVPIHSKLIELGFIDFIRQSRSGDYSNSPIMLPFNLPLHYWQLSKGKNTSDIAKPYFYQLALSELETLSYEQYRLNPFTFTLSRALVERIQSQNKEMVDFLRDRIQKAFKEALQRQPDNQVCFWFALEMARRGQPHIQGSLLIRPDEQEAVRMAFYEVNCDNKMTADEKRDCLRLGRCLTKREELFIKRGRLYTDLNWADYNLKERATTRMHYNNLRPIVAVSQPLIKHTKDYYSRLQKEFKWCKTCL
jgi:integrase